MTRRIIRTPEGWGLDTGSGAHRLTHPLAEILAGAPLETTGAPLHGPLLAPVDRQEIWAAGVTYQRSLAARVDESATPDVYDHVYQSECPEIFFKSVPERALGPDDYATVRDDSAWNVPEPELTLVVDHAGEVFGYTIGDDVSSRSIEGDSPLYLPQAKIWDGACVVGPWIVLAEDVSPPFDITLTIQRDGREVFGAVTSTSKMVRGFHELIGWLTSHLDFPHGVLLMTGTGIVPDDDVSLSAGDTVTIEVDQIGTLRHGVRAWKR